MIRPLSLLLAAVLLATSALAGDALKIAETAKTTVKKNPAGVVPLLGPAIEALQGKSTIQITIPAPGVTGAAFTGDTSIKVVVSEVSGSGSDYFMDIKFSKDPKYVAGASSVKINESNIGDVQGRVVLRATTVKIGKDQIVISIKNNVNSIYSQMYLNIGTFNIVKYPEGASTATRTFKTVATVGTFTKTFTPVTMDLSFTNKKQVVGDRTYWQGSAKGSAAAQ